MTSSPRTPPVVALVCSAGGLEALTAILGRLPADFPAAVIVLQHARPGQQSLLARILARRSRLPVQDAQHGVPLVEGRVRTVPPGRHALVTARGTLALIASDGPPLYRPSADLLLTSLALTLGPRAIAVILSGGGNDGATGAVALHDFGGTVIASDEASSRNFSMPAAAIRREGTVDLVLPVEAIADALDDALRADVGPRSLDRIPAAEVSAEPAPAPARAPVSL